jgi:MFS family permease
VTTNQANGGKLPDIDSAVISAVVGAYYPKLVSSVESARFRAQSAYAIANALAGGLVGASLFTVFSNAPTRTLVVGYVAVGIWIISAGLYIKAIASPLVQIRPENVSDGSGFVREVLANASTERKTIDDRQRNANIGAIVAVVVTAVSFGLLLFGASVTINGTVDLTSAGQREVSSICGHPLSSLTGEVNRASLGQAFIVVDVPSSVCKGTTEIRLATADVADVRS